MSQKLPYYYSSRWLDYLKEYNAFYQSKLQTIQTYDTNDFFWLITLYYSESRKQLELRTGDPYIMTPYWKHQDQIIKKKDIEKWFQKLNQIYLELPIQKEIIIHQFPLETYFQRIPILDLLENQNLENNHKFKKRETIIRYRAWVELDKYTLSEIKSNLRKSYKSIVNNFLKKYSCQVVIYNSISIQTIDIIRLAQRFRDSHYQQAQKETKTQLGWQLLIKMIENDEAILIEYQDSFLYFLTHPDYCYYGISASEKDQGIQVGLIFKAIEYLKEKNYKLLDMGMTYLSDNYQPFFSSEKENPKKAFDIGFFKSGFATRITPDYYYLFSS